ncbi:hypothetical protein OIV83_001387 [Microbotryomycetes sp. JL201]|nr:hypothetical protein OIV83_001387 [Microbotryomycetes sp. JL201]
MDQQLDMSHAGSATQGWSTGHGSQFDPDTPIVCASVWSHEEHQELQIRYTKTLEELAAARNEVIRLTVELNTLRTAGPAAAGHSMTTHSHRDSGLTENGDLAVDTPGPSEAHLHNASTSHSSSGSLPRPSLMMRDAPHMLPSAPPDPDVVERYRQEVDDWVRPVYAPEQLVNITNYLTSQAQVTNLRNALVDIDGNPPSPSEWKAMSADRLVVVNDVLNTCRTWRQQEEEHRRIAIAYMEKRWSRLCLCEDNGNWKAAMFLTKRLDEVLKNKHKELRDKRMRLTASRVQVNVAMTTGIFSYEEKTYEVELACYDGTDLSVFKEFAFYTKTAIAIPPTTAAAPAANLFAVLDGVWEGAEFVSVWEGELVPVAVLEVVWVETSARLVAELVGNELLSEPVMDADGWDTVAGAESLAGAVELASLLPPVTDTVLLHQPLTSAKTS